MVKELDSHSRAWLVQNQHTFLGKGKEAGTPRAPCTPIPDSLSCFCTRKPQDVPIHWHVLGFSSQAPDSASIMDIRVELWFDRHGGSEGISYTGHSHNILRTVRLGLNFLAQVTNMGLHEAGVPSFVITPDALD